MKRVAPAELLEAFNPPPPKTAFLEPEPEWVDPAWSEFISTLEVEECR